MLWQSLIIVKISDTRDKLLRKEFRKITPIAYSKFKILQKNTTKFAFTAMQEVVLRGIKQIKDVEEIIT